MRFSKGKCTNIVQELYLRRDIPCSSKLCTRCLEDIKGDSYGRTKPFLLSSNAPVNDTIKVPSYMVPDTNTFLHRVDVLEHAAITDAQWESGETINDRNDRAVIHGVQWYHEHLKKVTRDT